MTKLALRFVGDEYPELEQTEFAHPLLCHERRCIRGRYAGAYYGYSVFQWTKAVQGLSLLLLRAKAEAIMGNPLGVFARPNLVGHGASFAASLDYALDKQTTWLFDMFGSDKNGLAIARRAIHRTNPGRKRAGPVALSLNTNFLRADYVEISLNGQMLTQREELSELIQKMEKCDFAAQLPEGAELRVAG